MVAQNVKKKKKKHNKHIYIYGIYLVLVFYSVHWIKCRNKFLLFQEAIDDISSVGIYTQNQIKIK